MPRIQEKPTACKKTKTTNTVEGDLVDSSKPVCNVTKDALEEVLTEQKTVLGALKSQLQALQVHPL